MKKKIDIVAPVECPTLSPERQLLWDAANLIERHGHAKRALLLGDGSMCALGAMNCAGTGHAERTDTSVAGLRAYTMLRDRVESIPTWNNAPERTAAEVIQALRDAALS